jgi:hypothetical protein
MTEFCTCGTKLVEDARFCHRCGRPTSELAAESVPPPIPLITVTPAAVSALAQLPVSFSNPIALRVAFLMSLATIPMEMMPGLNLLFLIWWMAAGWCAVLLYRRLTGLSLSIGAGARLGSITGVLTFVGLAIVVALTMLVAGNEFFSQMEEMAKKNPDAAPVIHDPTMMFIFLLIFLGIMGAVVVGLCTAGGALGARFSARKANQA